tara:strand:+ start:196 stop:657 length:462 start_codon:yes stop_codon:yes gene_type:complete
MKITKRQLKSLIREEVSDISAIEDLLNDLLSQLEKLDVSIDYLSAAITGDNPLSLNVAQSSLGRFAGPRKQARNVNENNTITKKYLKDLVKQVVSEQDIPQEIEKAVESDSNLEQLLSAMAERLEELENQIQKVRSDYTAASARMGQIIGQQK